MTEILVAQIVKRDRLVSIVLDLEFVYDGLFCEWAYAVDLNSQHFSSL